VGEVLGRCATEEGGWVMDYVIERRPMVCGSAEAEAKVYRLIPCKRGNWLMAVNVPNPAAFVYFDDPKDLKSQGFGGRVIRFLLESEEVYEAKGPWHGNADSMFKDTGVDVRDKHLTRVVISEGRGLDEKYRTVLKGVLYEEKEPLLGRFERGRKLGEGVADGLGRMVFVYSEGPGGSSNGPVYPLNGEGLRRKEVDGEEKS